jgi:hypothetical protein
MGGCWFLDLKMLGSDDNTRSSLSIPSQEQCYFTELALVDAYLVSLEDVVSDFRLRRRSQSMTLLALAMEEIRAKRVPKGVP